MSYEIQSYNAQVICVHVCVYILRESISYRDRFGLVRETKYFRYQLISIYRFRIIAISIYTHNIYIYIYLFIYLCKYGFIYFYVYQQKI